MSRYSRSTPTCTPYRWVLVDYWSTAQGFIIFDVTEGNSALSESARDKDGRVERTAPDRECCLV